MVRLERRDLHDRVENRVKGRVRPDVELNAQALPSRCDVVQEEVVWIDRVLALGRDRALVCDRSLLLEYVRPRKDRCPRRTYNARRSTVVTDDREFYAGVKGRYSY